MLTRTCGSLRDSLTHTVFKCLRGTDFAAFIDGKGTKDPGIGVKLHLEVDFFY